MIMARFDDSHPEFSGDSYDFITAPPGDTFGPTPGGKVVVFRFRYPNL